MLLLHRLSSRAELSLELGSAAPAIAEHHLHLSGLCFCKRGSSSECRAQGHKQYFFSSLENKKNNSLFFSFLFFSSPVWYVFCVSPGKRCFSLRRSKGVFQSEGKWLMCRKKQPSNLKCLFPLQYFSSWIIDEDLEFYICINVCRYLCSNISET